MVITVCKISLFHSNYDKKIKRRKCAFFVLIFLYVKIKLYKYSKLFIRTLFLYFSIFTNANFTQIVKIDLSLKSGDYKMERNRTLLKTCIAN